MDLTLDYRGFNYLFVIIMQTIRTFSFGTGRWRLDEIQRLLVRESKVQKRVLEDLKTDHAGEFGAV